MITCDHHLDAIIAYRTWADDRDDHVGAVNNVHWRMDGHASVDIVYDASHRSYVEDKLSKNMCDPLFENP